MCKNVVLKVFFSLFCLLDLYMLYLTIGYFILGTKAPVLYNGGYAHFMGMYLMSIAFGVMFLILTGLLIFAYLKFIKKLKNKQ